LAAILSAGALTSTENGARFVLETSDPILASWLLGQFTKICVYVETEEELLALHTSAQKAGLLNSLIQDAGYTEFHGVATYTALAIGPGDLQKIKELTGHLPLL
jgi:PTH2 family peptidyl-tRNA hydrolase